MNIKDTLEELLRPDYPGVELIGYNDDRFTFSNRVEEPYDDEDDEDEEPEYGYSLYSGTYVIEDDKIRITEVTWGIAPPTEGK